MDGDVVRNYTSNESLCHLIEDNRKPVATVVAIYIQDFSLLPVDTIKFLTLFFNLLFSRRAVHQHLSIQLADYRECGECVRFLLLLYLSFSNHFKQDNPIIIARIIVYVL